MTRLVAATSLASEVSGFWTATAFKLLVSRGSGMIFDQHEPTANAP